MAIQTRSRVPSAAANGKNGHTLISDAKFRQLYALALKLRLLAEGKGLRALTGREAMLAGVAADLQAKDLLLGSEQAALAERLGEMWPGLRHDGAGAFGDRVIEAISTALADRMRSNRRVAVIFSEEPRAEKALAEARRIANAVKLPVLFVEDWQSAGNDRPAAKNGSKAPEGIGDMPVIPVDAQDVVAIYRVAHESIARAREGSGPTRIQCLAWTVGRKASNTATEDAVEHLERWLEARGLPAHEWRQEIAAEFDAETRKPVGKDDGSASSGEGLAVLSAQDDGIPLESGQA